MLLAKPPMCLKFARKLKISNHQTLGPNNIIRNPRLHCYSPHNPPHTNNCPPPSRKTPVPLENSITRLHKRFKIMVLSLCEERERTWPHLQQGLALSHTGISGSYCISTYWSSCRGLNRSRSYKARPDSREKDLTRRLQTFRVKLCISGQSVRPWELPSMLNQTVITNKSRSAWALWGALEPHHAGPSIWHCFWFSDNAYTASLNKKLEN